MGRHNAVTGSDRLVVVVLAIGIAGGTLAVIHSAPVLLAVLLPGLAVARLVAGHRLNRALRAASRPSGGHVPGDRRNPPGDRVGARAADVRGGLRDGAGHPTDVRVRRP
jgi:hypothetical protein